MADESNKVDITERKRVSVEVSEAYKKTDDSVWLDLEEYLFLGFLSSPTAIINKSFVFKTINHNEIRNIGFMRPMHSSPPESKALFRANFIAHSIFMIDGENLLFDRQKHLSKLIKIVYKIAPSIQDKIIENLGTLNEKASRLFPLTEVYVHENRSRYKWMYTQSAQINSPSLTGIPGTDEIGLNYSQQTWVAVNRLLDKKEEAERDWTNAKFIGSCFNSKGVKGIDERDRGHREKEKADVEELKLKVLYNYLNKTESGDEDPRKMVRLPDNRMAVVDSRHRADSAQELADQLSSALSGEKDRHDLIVEEHLRKLNERNKRIEEDKRTIYAAPLPQLESQEIKGMAAGSRVLGGKKEADAYISRMNALRIKHYEDTFHKVNNDLPQISGDETNKKGFMVSNVK